MDKITDSSFQRLVRNFSFYVDKYLFQSPLERYLINSILEHGEACIFGGVIRDFFLLRNHQLYHRDIDVVISVFSDDMLELIRKNIIKRNRYGGLKLEIGDHSYDIWSLSKTWAFTEGFPRFKGFHDLPASSFFNFNAAVFLLKERKLIFHSSFKSSIQLRLLDIVFEPNPFPELCIVKSYEYVRRFRMMVSPRLRKYLVEHFTSGARLEEIQLSHYGSVLFPLRELETFISNIDEHTNFQRHCY